MGGVPAVWGAARGAGVVVPCGNGRDETGGCYLPGGQGGVYGGAVIAIILLAPDGLYWTIRDKFFKQQAPKPIPAASKPDRSVHASVTAGTPLMKVEGLSKAFGGLRAVSNVSFEIAEGEILGIIGPNGAGKTTLFNLLNGVLPADIGTATLGGVSMLGKKVHQVCHMGVGRTFQAVRSFPRLPAIHKIGRAACRGGG